MCMYCASFVICIHLFRFLVQHNFTSLEEKNNDCDMEQDRQGNKGRRVHRPFEKLYSELDFENLKGFCAPENS